MEISKIISSLIVATVIIGLALAILLGVNMTFMEVKTIFAKKEFCKDNGFTGTNEISECISKDKISLYKVDCQNKGFKIECFWDKRERVKPT
jgi:hypothetical protein